MIHFLVNSEKPCDAQHGDGVCCAFAPQLVFTLHALSVNRLDEVSDGVDASAVEQVRHAVLRLKGMVGEASTLAAQLASAQRRRRLLCVDGHGRRRLPPLPTVDRPTAAVDAHRSPAGPLRELDTTDLTTPSTRMETSGTLESRPLVGEDARRNRLTSTISCDLKTVVDHGRLLDIPRVAGSQPAPPLAEVLIREGDWRTEPNQLDSGQRLPVNTPRNLVVEQDQPSGIPPVAATTCVTSNQDPRSSLTSGPRRHPAISWLLEAARDTGAPFGRVAESVLSVHYIIGGLKHGSTTPRCRRTPFHVVAAVLMAAVFICVLFLYYYYYEEEVCQSSCARTNGRTARSWTAALWNKVGLQFRHIAPPPI